MALIVQRFLHCGSPSPWASPPHAARCPGADDRGRLLWALRHYGAPFRPEQGRRAPQPSHSAGDSVFIASALRLRCVAVIIYFTNVF